MRIVHLCLASTYTEGYGYQENIMPRTHKKQGHDVIIVASTERIGVEKKIVYVEPYSKLNEDGIMVYRLSYKKTLSDRLNTKIRKYVGLIKILENFKPDVIFIHGTQSAATKDVVNYKKKHPQVTIYADCHADFNNSAKTFISRVILHEFFYKHFTRILLPYINYYYGVLPARCVFLNKVYGIPKEKIRLLVMGADDDIVTEVKQNGSKESIRAKYNNEGNFLIVAGGKIDKNRMEYFDLMKAVAELNNVTLILFGSISKDIEEAFNSYIKGNIKYVGWLNVKSTYELINASDLAVFPCLHSVLWEQTVGLGKPAIFHKIEGTTHISNGKNCMLLDNIDKNTLKSGIEKCIDNYEALSKEALTFSSNFLYNQISKDAIEL